MAGGLAGQEPSAPGLAGHVDRPASASALRQGAIHVFCEATIVQSAIVARLTYIECLHSITYTTKEKFWHKMPGSVNCVTVYIVHQD